MMKRIGKLFSGLVLGILSLIMCVAFAACSGGGDKGVYTVEVDGALRSWQYNFVNICTFGEEYYGMINIEDWGTKKLLNNDEGTCIGTGCKWTVTLDVSDASKYGLYITAHLVGNGEVYEGEGDYTYYYEGPYEKKSDSSYVLGEPDYCKVSLTKGFNLITEGYDFADYIPTGPWEIDSNTPDDDEFVVTNNNNTEGTRGLQDKLHPSVLLESVFGGATFNVSGGKIVSIVDVNRPM